MADIMMSTEYERQMPANAKKGEPFGSPSQNKIPEIYFYAFAAFTPLNASASLDLYRFPVFSCSTPLLMATSIADSVGCSIVPAAFLSPELIAVRSFLISDRTRVRFDRFTSAR